MEGEGDGGGVRIHVGGLGESVGKDDLLKIFSSLGSVDSVDFVRTKGRSFAYIDFSPSSDKSLTKLFSTYNGCVWKGGRLRLEKAKEHYLARLKREWEEADKPIATDPEVPSISTPSTHLNIFIPRLRKVKSMPLSGTGKHKYSFQRVNAPSLPKNFCGCEEHSKHLTPRENHVHDLEALNVGVNEEELNIMNSVMNKLFQKNNIPTSQLVVEEENEIEADEDVVEEESEIEKDQDNLIINVVSSGNKTRNSEPDISSRKRKSAPIETTATEEGYSERSKRTNNIQSSKKRQSIIPEGNGRQESSQAKPENKKPSQVKPENKKPSDVDPHTPSDGPNKTISGVKRSNENISWSQKSSWKALIDTRNSSFSVSSFLPGVDSSKVVQPESCNSDLVDLPLQENSMELDVTRKSTTKTKIRKQKSKRLTPTTTTEILPITDNVERNETAATDDIGSEAVADIVMSTDTNVEAEPLDIEESTEVDQCGEDKKLDDGKEEYPIKDMNTTEDYNAEEESLVLKENVDHKEDETETGKGPLKTYNESAEGTWLQKASWTQLVRDTSSSFSITQLFPNLSSEKREPTAINKGEGQSSMSNQSESAMKQKDASETARVTVDNTPVRTSEENKQIQTRRYSSERFGAKKIIRREPGSEETCTFMRSSASLKEWSKAKKALSEPRKKKITE